MGLKALPEPYAAIAKTSHRADFIAASPILDSAVSDAFDVDRIVVEVANQRPRRG
jgi:hypothetical protein